MDAKVREVDRKKGKGTESKKPGVTSQWHAENLPNPPNVEAFSEDVIVRQFQVRTTNGHKFPTTTSGVP